MVKCNFAVKYPAGRRRRVGRPLTIDFRKNHSAIIPSARPVPLFSKSIRNNKRLFQRAKFKFLCFLKYSPFRIVLFEIGVQRDVPPPPGAVHFLHYLSGIASKAAD